jgi:hypothetical protein
LTKIERDYGAGGVQVAYEYGYNSDGARVWKRDVLAGQEYRYICRIGCGGVPMRVYNRAMGGSSWVSVEDYLPAGNALGYNENWRYRYSGGELLVMGTTGEPSGYYPMDSNGLAVQNVPAQPCVCAVVAPAQTAVCPPLGYGGCEGGQCDATPPDAPLPPNGDPIVAPSPTPPRNDPVIAWARPGPWNVIGCTPSQIAEIGKHLDDVCRFRVGGSTPLRRCLQNMCQSGFTIRCGAGAECEGLCSFTRVPGGEIVLCPLAFTPQCGCLGKTIVHEMAHECGVFDEPGARRCEWYMYHAPSTPPCPR